MTDVLTDPTREYPTIGEPEPADPMADYAAQVDAYNAGAEPEPAEPEPAEPEPPKRRPGPRPNPHSARQRKLRSKAAAAPRRRATPNTAAPAEPEPANVHERGALAVIGWAARPLAVAGLAMGLAAGRFPDGDPRGVAGLKQATALTLDSLTLIVHGPGLAKGAARAAEQIPWMAKTLERAAAISPYADALEASTAIVLQLLANHGVVPVSGMLGTLTPRQLQIKAGVVEPEPGEQE